MRNYTKYYKDMIEAISITTGDHTAEFINAGDEQVGIRLDGRLAYFRIRGCRADIIRPTKTGITIHENASVMGFVDKHTDEDAIWLAMAAHGLTKPVRRHVFATYVFEDCPELMPSC